MILESRRVRQPHAIYLVAIVILSLITGALLFSTFRNQEPNAISTAAVPSPRVSQNLAGMQEAFSSIASSVAPTVVNINTQSIIERRIPRDPMDEFLRQFFGEDVGGPEVYRQRRASLGSGFIVRSDGYIVTNGHVVNGAQQINVKLMDGKVYEAKFIAADPRVDLAVIKINAGRLPVVRMGDADRTKVGYWAIAMGSPFGLTETMTVGVISAKGRVLTGSEGNYRDLLQTDASINPGNSGGPLLNLQGEVIGINQAILSPSGTGNIGIGFAIPMNGRTKELINRLIAGRSSAV